MLQPHNRRVDPGEQVLQREAAVSAEVSHFLTQLENSRHLTRSLLESMSDEEFLGGPACQLPQIACLTAEIAREELYWMAQCFAGHVPSEEEWGRLGGSWSAPAWRDALALSRPEALKHLEDVHHYSREVLRVSRDIALESDYSLPGNPGARAEGRWILHHVLLFEAERRGQIALVLDCVRASRERTAE